MGEPVPDSLPETVPGGYGGYLRQGVYTGQREDGTHEYGMAAAAVLVMIAALLLCGIYPFPMPSVQ